MPHSPDPPIDRLLEHRTWVRRVARALCRDAWAADDLEQELWLAAIRRPPPDGASPRGWLARVLRHDAIDSGRAERRRAAREIHGGRRPPPREPADIVAEAESLRGVADAVLTLDEPYRTAVLLRWWEGVPPGEIAQRQGVPVETVRTRLKRALEMLRARLDREHGGDRHKWTSVLLLAAGAGSGSPAGPGAGGGGGAVGTLALAGAVVSWKGAVVAAAGLALLGWMGMDALDGPRAGDEVAALPPVEDAPEPDAAASVAAQRAARPRVDEPRATGSSIRPPFSTDIPAGAWLAVHVIDEDGRAVPGSVLRLSFAGAGAVALEDVARLRPLVGDRAVGASTPFVLQDVPAVADGLTLRLEGRAPGCAPSEPVDVRLEFGRTQVSRVFLVPPQALDVRVVDAASGAPIAGALVASSSELGRRGTDLSSLAEPAGDGWATTDAAGACRLKGLGRGDHDLTVSGRRIVKRAFSTRAGRADPVTIPVEWIANPARIRAVVRGRGDVPAEGVNVTLSTTGGQVIETRKTNVVGEALFEAVPPGTSVVTLTQGAWERVFPRTPGAAGEGMLGPGYSRWVDAAAGAETPIRLGWVAGDAQAAVRVVDADGNPLPGHRVRLSELDERITGEDGIATWTGLEPLQPRVVIVDGWTGGSLSVTSTGDAAPVDVVAGVLRVPLRVVPTDGSAVPAGARLWVWSGQRGGSHDVGAGGAVVVEGAQPGRLIATLNVPGFAAAAVSFELPAAGLDEPLVVPLARGGRVVLSGAARSVVQFSLRTPDGGTLPFEADGAAAGRLATAPVAAGSYVVNGATDGLPFRADVVVRDGEDTVVSLPGK